MRALVSNNSVPVSTRLAASMLTFAAEGCIVHRLLTGKDSGCGMGWLGGGVGG